MISYPGRILARFGRYEAVEEIGPLERAHLWRAWDPFLERFVIVASLPGLPPDDLYRMLPNLDQALSVWIGGEDPGLILDFGPGSRVAPAYFVFPIARPQDPAAKSTDGADRSLILDDDLPLAQAWARVLRRTGSVVASSAGSSLRKIFKRIRRGSRATGTNLTSSRVSPRSEVRR